jgi:hypothetical protein
MKKKLKTKKLNPIVITDNTLETQITFFIGTKKEIGEALLPCLSLNAGNRVKVDLDNPLVDGECLGIDFPKDGLSIVIWADKSRISSGLIAHEIYHAVCDNLETKNIPINKETEEVIAYLLMFYINELQKELSK